MIVLELAFYLRIEKTPDSKQKCCENFPQHKFNLT